MGDTVIHLSAGVAVTLLVAFVGLVFGFGRVLLGQFERRLQERSAAIADLRQAERDAGEKRLVGIEVSLEKEAGRIGDLLGRIEKLNVTLPLEYVRREDWIRFSATIDAKLDKLAEMIHQRFPGGDQQ